MDFCHAGDITTGEAVLVGRYTALNISKNYSSYLGGLSWYLVPPFLAPRRWIQNHWVASNTLYFIWPNTFKTIDILFIWIALLVNAKTVKIGQQNLVNFKPACICYLFIFLLTFPLILPSEISKLNKVRFHEIKNIHTPLWMNLFQFNQHNVP